MEVSSEEMSVYEVFTFESLTPSPLIIKFSQIKAPGYLVRAGHIKTKTCLALGLARSHWKYFSLCEMMETDTDKYEGKRRLDDWEMVKSPGFPLLLEKCWYQGGEELAEVIVGDAVACKLYYHQIHRDIMGAKVNTSEEVFSELKQLAEMITEMEMCAEEIDKQMVLHKMRQYVRHCSKLDDYNSVMIEFAKLIEAFSVFQAPSSKPLSLTSVELEVVDEDSDSDDNDEIVEEQHVIAKGSHLNVKVSDTQLSVNVLMEGRNLNYSFPLHRVRFIMLCQWLGDSWVGFQVEQVTVESGEERDGAECEVRRDWLYVRSERAQYLAQAALDVVCKVYNDKVETSREKLVDTTILQQEQAPKNATKWKNPLYTAKVD